MKLQPLCNLNITNIMEIKIIKCVLINKLLLISFYVSYYLSYGLVKAQIYNFCSSYRYYFPVRCSILHVKEI
jgi:hypothetical protein